MGSLDLLTDVRGSVVIRHGPLLNIEWNGSVSGSSRSAEWRRNDGILTTERRPRRNVSPCEFQPDPLMFLVKVYEA